MHNGAYASNHFNHPLISDAEHCVTSWTRVAYPTRPVALATGRKPNPNILMWQAKLEMIYANL